MRADKAELLDRVVELLQSGDAAGRIDAGEAGKAVRIALHRLVDLLVGDFGRAAHAQVAATHGNQEGALDAGAVHLLDVLLERQAPPVALLDPHLVTEVLIGGRAALGDDLRRVHVDDNVDGAKPKLWNRRGRRDRPFADMNVLDPDSDNDRCCALMVVISLRSRRPERTGARQAVAAHLTRS